MDLPIEKPRTICTGQDGNGYYYRDSLLLSKTGQLLAV